MNLFAQAAAVLMLVPLLFACSNHGVRDEERTASARINTSLGRAYMEKQDHVQAMNKLERALSQDPDYAPAHVTMAALYERLGEHDKADQHYRTAIRLDPKTSLIRNNYGAFLCNRDRINEAEEQFQAAVKDPLYTTPEYAYTNAGLCALRVQDPVKAERYFRAALTRQPKFPVALFHMASLSFEQKEFLSARAYLQRYTEVAQETPASLWLGVQLEHELGDRNAEASYALRLRARFPDSKEARLLKDRERNE